MVQQGLIHVYYGEGKGKTTAALGLALRASGCGKRVLFLQFLKGGPCGELAQLALLPGLTVWRGQEGMRFVEQMTEKERAETLQNQNALLARAVSLAEAGACELLALDEVLDACQEGLLDESLLFSMLPKKFTVLQYRLLLQAVTNKNIDNANIYKKIAQKPYIVPLDEKEQGFSHRAARYYSFDFNAWEAFNK